MTETDFGTWLKQERLKKGLSQIALALKLKISDTTIWNLENHKRQPSLRTKRRIKRFFEDGKTYEPIKRIKKGDKDVNEKIQNAINRMPVAARKLFSALVAEAYHTEDGYPAIWRTVSLPIKTYLERSGKKVTDANIARVRKAAEKLDKALLSTGIGWTRIRSDVWERSQIADQCGISNDRIFIRFSMTFASAVLANPKMLGLEAK